MNTPVTKPNQTDSEDPRAPAEPSADGAPARPSERPAHAPATAGERRVAALPVDWATEPTPVYANGAHVVHTPREFAVIFDDTAPFPGRLAPATDPGSTRGRIVASLRLGPDAFFQVVCALASSWNRFSASYFDPRVSRPRFVLVDAGQLKLDAQDPPESSS